MCSLDSRSVVIYIVWFYACLIRSSDPNSKENKIQEHFTEEDKCGKTRDWDAAVNRSIKLNKNRSKKQTKTTTRCTNLDKPDTIQSVNTTAIAPGHHSYSETAKNQPVKQQAHSTAKASYHQLQSHQSYHQPQLHQPQPKRLAGESSNTTGSTKFPTTPTSAELAAK